LKLVARDGLVESRRQLGANARGSHGGVAEVSLRTTAVPLRLVGGGGGAY
jgi:hypothetical protein